MSEIEDNQQGESPLDEISEARKEAERDLSGGQFSSCPKIHVVPSSERAEYLAKSQYPCFYKTFEQKISTLISGACSSVYSQLDSFSGGESFSLINSSEFYKLFQETLEYLAENKIIQPDQWSGIRRTCYNDAPGFYRLDLAPFFAPGATDGAKIKSAIGHGFAKDFGIAFSKGIGELLERYFLCLYFRKNFIRGSYRDLKNKNFSVLDPGLMAGFADWQKECNARYKMDEESVFSWEKAKRLTDNKPVYLPAQLLHWNYILEKNEPYLCEFNTNGAGGWFSLEGALLGGLYEVIQRDGFLIFWLNKLTPVKIDPHTIPNEKFQKLLAESERHNFKIHCLNVTTDLGIPTFVTVIEDLSEFIPKFSLGGGCYCDPLRALFRSFEEAWSVYYWIRPYGDQFRIIDESYIPFVSQLGQTDRLTFWGNPARASDFKFLISGKTVPYSELKFDQPFKFDSQAEELKFLSTEIEKKGEGYEIYFFEAHNKILSELNYHSVQVVVPQLVPLYLNEPFATLGAKRLKEVPAKLGYEAAKEFNKWPHPFP